MGIRPELWLDDSVKGIELPTSCITLSKLENEFSSYSTNVSRLISFTDLKVPPSVKSHDYHVLLTQMIAIGIQNILPVNIREVIMNFCFFFNAIGQNVPSEETLWFLEMYFPPAFFNVSVYFTTLLIKEIQRHTEVVR
jgi:hypothetical protein